MLVEMLALGGVSMVKDGVEMLELGVKWWGMRAYWIGTEGMVERPKGYNYNDKEAVLKWGYTD